MPYTITQATKRIANLKKRIKIVQGGTSAGKTIGILQVLIDKAQRDTEPTLTSIVSESFPHLKRGAIKDFLDILETHKYFKDSRWNKTDYTYTFETGSKIEFFSADQPGKVRGPRRKRLFINEANNISFETFEQLEIRTFDEIYIDYNPVMEFWVQTELLGKRDDVDFIRLTYKDNESLDEQIVKSIEQRMNRSNWWKVYGLGEFGDAEGRVYQGWQVIDEVPHEARLERHWLDFGYSNDPTAIGDIFYYNGGYILDEQTYQKGLSNKQIADIILNLPKGLTIADCSEPKSIDEIRSYGVNIMPTLKGADSIVHGIQMVQEQKISVTKRSLNILKEYRNYMWKKDKEGRIINEPEGIWDHHMDGVRYALSSIAPMIQRRDLMTWAHRIPTKPKKNPAR